MRPSGVCSCVKRLSAPIMVESVLRSWWRDVVAWLFLLVCTNCPPYLRSSNTFGRCLDRGLDSVSYLPPRLSEFPSPGLSLLVLSRWIFSYLATYSR